MKLVLPGGRSQIGNLLARHFRAAGHQVVLLGRGGGGDADTVAWDGKTLGPWAAGLDGADVVSSSTSITPRAWTPSRSPMSISLKTVYSKKHKIRAHLRRCLEKLRAENAISDLLPATAA